MDGSLGSRSAALLEPYQDDPDNRGLLMMSPEALRQQVIQADKEGFQLGIHAIGDWAVRETLEAFALAQRMNGRRDSRHRIEHAQILTESDLLRFGELDVVASMQPFHCIDDLRWVEGRLGTERCRLAYAWKSLKEQSYIAFGTDWPVVPLNPMLTLYAAVTRKDTTGFPSKGWMTAERLTIEEAIEAYTLGSAYAEFLDEEKGSLSPGKFADIVVLDVNLLDATPEEIRDAEVVMTFLGGEIVYQRDE
jgi:predicted amidohydrolase YtcJ